MKPQGDRMEKGEIIDYEGDWYRSTRVGAGTGGAPGSPGQQSPSV